MRFNTRSLLEDVRKTPQPEGITICSHCQREKPRGDHAPAGSKGFYIQQDKTLSHGLLHFTPDSERKGELAFDQEMGETLLYW